MTWKSSSGEALYPEGTGKDSLFRLRTKIESCVTVAKIFAYERPQYFQLKLTPVLLNYAFIMRDDKVIVIFYGLPWKGKDSLIVEARKNQRKTAKGSGRTKSIYGNDLYGFLEGFFDAIWNEPNWRFVQLTEADKQ